jgi:transcriptional regulator with XRE-family HTH domain
LEQFETGTVRLSRSIGGRLVKNPVDLHIGQRVRHRRWLLGMTQQQLALAVGIRFQQIQKYESGANRISASRLWDLARALDMPVSFFFEGLVGDKDAAAMADDGLLQNKETMDLVRAYYGLDEGPRRRLLELAKALSSSSESHSPRA